MKVVKDKILTTLNKISHELVLLIAISIVHGVLGMVVAHKVMSSNGVITIKVEDVKH